MFEQIDKLKASAFNFVIFYQYNDKVWSQPISGPLECKNIKWEFDDVSYYSSFVIPKDYYLLYLSIVVYGQSDFSPYEKR